MSHNNDVMNRSPLVHLQEEKQLQKQSQPTLAKANQQQLDLIQSHTSLQPPNRKRSTKPCKICTTIYNYRHSQNHEREINTVPKHTTLTKMTTKGRKPAQLHSTTKLKPHHKLNEIQLNKQDIPMSKCIQTTPLQPNTDDTLTDQQESTEIKRETYLHLSKHSTSMSKLVRSIA